MTIKFLDRKSDIVGMVTSVLCLIHCVSLPFIFAAGIFSSSLFLEDMHWLDYVFIFLAFLAVVYSSRKTNQNWIRNGLWITLVVFSAAILLHEIHNAFLYVSVCASFCLIILHFLNFYQNGEV